MTTQTDKTRVVGIEDGKPREMPIDALNDFHLRNAIKKEIEEATILYHDALKVGFYSASEIPKVPRLFHWSNTAQLAGLLKDLTRRHVKLGTIIWDGPHHLRHMQRIMRTAAIIGASESWTTILFESGAMARDPHRRFGRTQEFD